MSRADAIVDAITRYSKVAIAVMIVLTVLVGAGASQVEQTSSLDQFQSDTPEAEDLDYIDTHFSTGEENTTTVQIIVRGDNVLDRTTLLETLRYEQSLREDSTINKTLSPDSPPTGIANVVATAAIKQEQGAALQARAGSLNDTALLLRDALDTVRSNPDADVRAQFEGVQAETNVSLDSEDYRVFQQAAEGIRSNVSEMRRTVESGAQTVLAEEFGALEERRVALNRTSQLLKDALDAIRTENADIRTQFEAVQANTSVPLGDEEYVIFEEAATALQAAESPEEIERAYQQGTQGVLADESRQLRDRSDALNATGQLLGEALGTIAQDPTTSPRTQFENVQASAPIELDEDDWQAFNGSATTIREFQANIEQHYRLGTQGVLREEFETLQSESAALQSGANEFGNGAGPSLAEQIDQLESMDDSAVQSTVETVFSSANGGSGVLGFMSSKYDAGSERAEATMLLVTQRTDAAVAPGGTVSDRIVDAQLAMGDIAEDNENEYLIFGSGIITDEINRSMTDSMLIVGPLALVFVLLALAIGYRDVLDILLGLFGIVAVLVWTFGFMGWTDIDFNQIFIAVPVLLIGLSIDYAIHIFMRHREERTEGDDLGPRESMRTALVGVGIALTLVTATTVIGFLSNLTSPVPPIREFGVVSAVGITAALLVFGILIPALKVEVDEFLEGHGIDRHKRAIGTGGGRLSQALRAGSISARKAPYAVIVFALLLSVAGAYGGSQVDTTFAQEDFLAEDPPGWMEELPEPFKPGEYTAKSNLNYVDERFGRETSQAQLLIRGDVATVDALDRLDDARETMTEQDVTQDLANGEPDLQSPLSVMRTVAANNETFNATFRNADPNGDGVPDGNVTAVYETLYDVAPQQAQSVLYRTDDEYEAARVIVSIRGDASSSAVTEQMRSVADEISGNGVEASATGQTILFEIVQDQLLETVIQSLLITLVAVFAFLMVVYRISDGSATLGFVTLLPVVLSVAWILGTMYLFDIPFNVMTGMITSLTVGLGVAYSIHLSERYNQELERSDSVWEALDRAVTGTGGALLGSAATTVGGFGVLVFAILPPLQQFGLITGLTIIYAFLASVLVLPSLLVVWTRLFGPDWTFQNGGEEGNDDGQSSEVDAEEDPVAVPGAAVDDATAFERTSGAERSVGTKRLPPGETTAVTVRMDRSDDRIALRENVAAGTLSLRSAKPEPAEFAVREESAFLLWDNPDSPITVEYDVTALEIAEDGSTISLNGAVLTPEGDGTVVGDDTITVVSDLFGRVQSGGEITEGELRLATEYFASGRLSASEFERLCRIWLEDES